MWWVSPAGHAPHPRRRQGAQIIRAAKGAATCTPLTHNSMNGIKDLLSSGTAPPRALGGDLRAAGDAPRPGRHRRPWLGAERGVVGGSRAVGAGSGARDGADHQQLPDQDTAVIHAYIAR